MPSEPNRCSDGGHLVSGEHTIPADPTDFDVIGLPVVGCSRLFCRVCRVHVRNEPGLSFSSPKDVTSAQLTELHALPDLLASPLIHQTQPTYRLYLCRCSRYLETSASTIAAPDHDSETDPNVPWRCPGHPRMSLPHDVDGVVVSSQSELRDLVLRGLHGFHPPRTRASDVERGAWIALLHARLGLLDAQVVANAVLECIEDPDARTRGLVLGFFKVVALGEAQMRVLQILEGDCSLFRDVPDAVTTWRSRDKTLDASLWRVLAPLVGMPGRARDFARTEALAGRGTRAHFDALAAFDTTWFLDHLEDIARRGPGRGSDLVSSFIDLPDDISSQEPRARLRTALADGEPLDAIAEAARGLANRMRGVEDKETLPNLRTGTRLELVVEPPAKGDAWSLCLRITTRDNAVTSVLLQHDHQTYLRIFLEDKTTPECLVYFARGAEPRENVPPVPSVPTQVAPLAAWDYRAASPTVRIYDVSGYRADLKRVDDVQPGYVDATTARLRAEGYSIGATHSWNRFVWCFDDTGARIWSDTSVVVYGRREEMVIGLRRNPTRVPTAEIVEVQTFDIDLSHRGVACALANGREVILVEQFDDRWKLPFYSREEMDMDVEWAWFLGRDLAKWLGVKYVDAT